MKPRPYTTRKIAGIEVRFEAGIRYKASYERTVDCGEPLDSYSIVACAVTRSGRRIGRWEARMGGMTRLDAARFVDEFNGPNGSIVWPFPSETCLSFMRQGA